MNDTPSNAKIWLLASRPKTLPAAIAPVLIGVAIAYADGNVHVISTACALLGAILIQIGTNFANDYFDFVKGTDTPDRKGPTRATQAGLVSSSTMRAAFIITFALVLIPGAYIIYRGGWPFLAIGLLGIASGILYTGGPYPLGYLGLGDVFVFVFFGPVAVAGTHYLNTLEWSMFAAVSGFGPGLISVALLTVNNLRDMDEDRVAGKMTLPARFGRRFARLEYLTCIVAAAAVMPMYLYAATGQRLFALVPLVVIPLASPSIRTVFTQTDGPALNGALGATGRVLVVFAVVFAVAWTV
jgi:1,4-dihydroxy-2-naphthoate octaprenyltransferase